MAAETELTDEFRADLTGLREQVVAALDRSIDNCARCKVCDEQVNAAMAAIGTEFDRLHAALEHAASASAGSHEGTRLWMLDCGELVAKHRERAERDGAKLAEIRAVIGTFFQHYGHSELPLFRVAQDLAHGIRQVLDRDQGSSEEGEDRG